MSTVKDIDNVFEESIHNEIEEALSKYRIDNLIRELDDVSTMHRIICVVDGARVYVIYPSSKDYSALIITSTMYGYEASLINNSTEHPPPIELGYSTPKIFDSIKDMKDEIDRLLV